MITSNVDCCEKIEIQISQPNENNEECIENIKKTSNKKRENFTDTKIPSY